MRRVRIAALLCVAVSAPAALWSDGAGAHIGHAPTYVYVRASGFEPREVTVAQGDRVFWVWESPSFGRSVTADEGQTEFFDSDPARAPAPTTHQPPNDLYSHAFAATGVYGYFDKADPSIRGAVTVIPDPTGNAVDTDPPEVAGLAVRPAAFCARRTRACRRPVGGSLVLAVSERANGVLKIKPRTRGGSSRIIERAVRAGHVRLRLPQALRPGRYSVSFAAEDEAANRSAETKATFTVLRRTRRAAGARASLHQRRCGGYTFRGRDYLVRSQRVSCAFAKRWTRAYLSSRRRPSRAWRCHSTPPGTRTRIPFVCQSGNRSYWVERG